jgi:hypothetical protein
LRNKTSDLRLASEIGYQYYCEEIRPPPLPKLYQNYRQNGFLAAATGKIVDGVKGLWTLDHLPYAKYIHWVVDPMHCFGNIIKDSVKVLRPSIDDFVNRTESISVRDACRKFKIFRHLWTPNGKKLMKAKWAFSTDEVKNVHSQMAAIEGISGRLKTPFKSNGGVTTHNKIVWATVFARKVLKGKGSRPVTDNILNLFDVITRLCGYSFDEKEIQQLSEVSSFIISEHEGLLPPCEGTYTLHEIIHVIEQIRELGPPSMCSLFKYERQMKYLKNIVMNRNYPVGSLVKNYLLGEMSFMSTGIIIQNVSIMRKLYASTDPHIQKALSKLLKALGKLWLKDGNLEHYPDSESTSDTDRTNQLQMLIQFLLT